MPENKIQTYNTSDLEDIRHNLVKEIRDASQGVENSLSYIENKINKNERENGTKAQVIVFGGSNLISALAVKESDLINIQDIVKEDLPTVHSKDIFQNVIAKLIKPDIKYLALNFGYPLEVVYRNNQMDGKLITGTKEHAFEGLIGKNIGEEVEKYIFNTKGIKIITGVANDIVCLILASSVKTPIQELVGGIVGTGFNFGFYTDNNTILNLESGNFDKFPQTDSGKKVDTDSVEPGLHKFEKEISGGYLYKHYNYYADTFDLPVKNTGSTVDMDKVALQNESCKNIITNLYKRSASLVACQIAAIHDFKNHSKLTVHMEGSLFWKGQNYKDYVLDTLLEMGIPYGKVRMEKIEKSYILGAAKLVL